VSRLAAVLTLLAFAGAGCSLGAGEETIPADSAGRLVLQQADVPDVFERFDSGRIAQADLPGGDRADPARFGREQGWKARYRRDGTSETAGPLVIESLVDVFDAADGAEDELAAIRAELETPAQPVVTPVTRLDDPELGDEALAWSALVPAQPRDTVFYTVAWRHRNAVASVSVNGFDGRLDLETAVDLARKQQARLESAG
jgi:hypothetical protein